MTPKRISAAIFAVVLGIISPLTLWILLIITLTGYGGSGSSNNSSVGDGGRVNYTLLVHGYLSLFVVVCVSLVPGLGSRAQAAIADAALQTKREFVQYISHEIRGPLQVVKVGLSLLQEDIRKLIKTGSNDNQTSSNKPHDTNSPTLVSSSGPPLPAVSSSLSAPTRQMVCNILDTTDDITRSCELSLTALNDMLIYDKLDSGMLYLELQVISSSTFLNAVGK